MEGREGRKIYRLSVKGRQRVANLTAANLLSQFTVVHELSAQAPFTSGGCLPLRRGAFASEVDATEGITQVRWKGDEER